MHDHLQLTIMAVWRASNFKKVRRTTIISAEECNTQPDYSAEYFVEGRRALKAVKAL
jgi:hypothetical protein